MVIQILSPPILNHLQEQLNQEILRCTAEIRELHPELYAMLNETPLILGKQTDKVTNIDLLHYWISLQNHLLTRA